MCRVNEDVVRTDVLLSDDGCVVRIYSESPDHAPVSAFRLSDAQAALLAERLITRDYDDAIMADLPDPLS